MDSILNGLRSKFTSNVRFAEQAFDGLMLGDGGLAFQGNYAHFRMGLADNRKYKQREQIPAEKLLAFLQHITVLFKYLDTIPCADNPKISFHKQPDGRMFSRCDLITKSSDFCTKQYFRWYKNGEKHHSSTTRYSWYTAGEKIVPDDLVLTPISLAYFFMGDGSSVWIKDTISITINLCTDDFKLHDIVFLENQLRKFSLHTMQVSVPNGRIRIGIPQNSVDDFMNLVKPYMVEPYLFKLKYKGSYNATNLDIIGIKNLIGK
jgi:hypothetical protein